MLDTPGKYLEETGLLFHLNRTVFHPLGMSLGVVVEEAPSTESDEVKLVIHTTDNPAGFTFGEQEMKQQAELYRQFVTTSKPRVLTRGKRLGFMIQPLPDE